MIKQSSLGSEKLGEETARSICRFTKSAYVFQYGPPFQKSGDSLFLIGFFLNINDFNKPGEQLQVLSVCKDKKKNFKIIGKLSDFFVQASTVDYVKCLSLLTVKTIQPITNEE